MLYKSVAQKGGWRKLWRILLNSAKCYTPINWSKKRRVHAIERKGELLQFSKAFLSPILSYMYMYASTHQGFPHQITKFPYSP